MYLSRRKYSNGTDRYDDQRELTRYLMNHKIYIFQEFKEKKKILFDIRYFWRTRR